MSPEVHIFIIWEKARVFQEKILDDIALHFTIIKQYEIAWTPSLAASNIIRFCGTRLGNNLQYKIDNCGIGEFLVVVVRDENPVYENRKTFHGYADVNIKMFEAKQRYREWTGGGIRVHATDNVVETNHDLTLLIGKNVEDFLKSRAASEKEKLHKDLEGAKGWDTIRQLFYVLNNTVRYAVMRGYGELSTGDFIDHGDTDIMTDDYDNLWLIVNSPKKYANTLKPKANVQIGDNSYLLDIWNCGWNGNNYFDPIWSRCMLDTAIEWQGIKILNPQNDFYCLLYHCLTNKGYIADDYLQKLFQYKQTFGIEENDWNKVLVQFLKDNHYEVIRPKDNSNPFQLSNPDIAEYALRYGGVCIYVGEEGTTRIFEKENSVVINGPRDSIEIEKKILASIVSLPASNHNNSITSRAKTIYTALVPKKIRHVASRIKKRLICKR